MGLKKSVKVLLWTGNIAQLVEDLPSIHEVPRLISSIPLKAGCGCILVIPSFRRRMEDPASKDDIQSSVTQWVWGHSSFHPLPKERNTKRNSRNEKTDKYNEQNKTLLDEFRNTVDVQSFCFRDSSFRYGNVTIVRHLMKLNCTFKWWILHIILPQKKENYFKFCRLQYL